MGKRSTPFQSLYRDTPRKPAYMAREQRQPRVVMQPVQIMEMDVAVAGRTPLFRYQFDEPSIIHNVNVQMTGMAGDMAAVLIFNGQRIFSLPLTEGANRVNVPVQRVGQGSVAEVALLGEGSADSVSLSFDLGQWNADDSIR